MTAPSLLAYICAALLLQLVAGISVALWRRSVRASQVPPAAPAAPTPRGAWAGFRELRVARREFEDAEQTQCSFYLESVDGAALPPFLPGQFLTFELEIGEARTITRCYSLSDRPRSTSSYRVTVKRLSSPAERPDLPHGVASCHFHDRVREGDVLKVRAPAGVFVIHPEETLPVVLIAGGIGITPLMSMLLWCVEEQPKRPIDLYYGVRNHLDHAFKQVLDELARSHPAFRVHVVYSRPSEGDTLGRDFEHEGHIDVELLERTLPDRRRQFYVCGPPPMMASLIPALEAWGIPKGDIHHEAFGPASARAAPALQGAAAAEPLEIRFRRSGRTVVWQGEDANLLDFAERHGLAVESGCRAGSCGSCDVRVLSGTVEYAEKPEYEVADGHCLLCLGTPASALEIEA
jgi:ferredoxin-NADP reductase